MRFPLLCLLIAGLTSVFGPASGAQTITTEASHAVIMDYETGEILYSKDGGEPMIPASMTKIMTAHLVFERLKLGEIALTDTFTTSENAWRTGGWASGGSTMGLAIGDAPTVEELLHGIITLSGNDACIVAAEGISGSEEAFAAEMTALARNMGLGSATFENSTGLYAENQRISAEDLARLARYHIRDFPEFYAFYSETEYEWRGISQPNRNPLLGQMEGVDGLKTGHLEVSGFGLTASAERDGERRILVINGLPTRQARALEAERLMRMAFASFETRRIMPEALDLPDLPVWMGERSSVEVALAEPVVVSGLKRAFPNAKTELVYAAPLEAPIMADEEVAQFVVTLEGREPISFPVLAIEGVARSGFFGQVLEGVRVLIEGSAGAGS